MSLPRLTKNALYWQAAWFDSSGKRRFKSLGARESTTKAEALRQLDDFVRARVKAPLSIDIVRAPALRDFIERYMEERADVSTSTRLLHKVCCERLLEHLPPTIRLDRITRAHATSFRNYLGEYLYRRGKVKGEAKHTLSPATIRRYLTTAKQIFKWAVDHDLLGANPFDRIRIGAPPSQEGWVYVPAEVLNRLYPHCPNLSWRVAFALVRLAGLRSNEVIRAELSWIDWEERLLRIRPKRRNGRELETTKQSRRSVPICQELYDLLREAYEAAEVGQGLIAPGIYQRRRKRQETSISKRAGRIVAAAGLGWSRPMHTLRKSLETDWLAKYPVFDVCDWLGHDPDVAKAHYHQSKRETIAKVTGVRPTEAGGTPAPETPSESRNVSRNVLGTTLEN